VRRGPTKPENGSAKVGRRASSDSAPRDRRNPAVSRQESRAGPDQADGDGLSVSALGASLLPDGDDGLSPEDEAAETGADTPKTTRSKRNVDDSDVYKVLVLGSQGVGKTTLVEQLMTSEYLANKDNSFTGK